MKKTERGDMFELLAKKFPLSPPTYSELKTEMERLNNQYTIDADINDDLVNSVFLSLEKRRKGIK